MQRPLGRPDVEPTDPFRYFRSSPEVIRLAALMYVRFPLSLRKMKDLLFQRGIDTCHETVRHWWDRFGPMLVTRIFAASRSVVCERSVDGSGISNGSGISMRCTTRSHSQPGFPFRSGHSKRPGIPPGARSGVTSPDLLFHLGSFARENVHQRSPSLSEAKGALG